MVNVTTPLSSRPAGRLASGRGRPPVRPALRRVMPLPGPVAWAAAAAVLAAGVVVDDVVRAVAR